MSETLSSKKETKKEVLMKKQFLKAAVVCALIGGVIPVVAVAESRDSLIVNDPNQKVYIERTVYADNAKAKKEAPTSNQLVKLAPAFARLTDPNATPETLSLYSYLAALSKTDNTIFGHQNDAHHKMFRINSGTNSDIKDVTGSLAGIIGIDALSLTGSELTLTPEEKAQGITLVDKAAAISIKAADEGGIITLSMHMPNFELIKERGKKADGTYDYSGYSPNKFKGDIVRRILPGGDLNEVYNGYLDLVADYALRLQDAKVPVIFRPLHEHNGGWFWWGAKYCSSEQFVELFQYTVKYMRDTKQVHNFLYAISPNGPFKTPGEYLDRYPGNRYVDIMGFDTYDDNPPGLPKNDPWFRDFETSLQVVAEAAKSCGKLPALTEVGVRQGGSLAVAGNKDKRWFSDVSVLVRKYHLPYFMTWSNFEKEQHNFFAPYMVSDTRGHEMINDFIDFYNEPSSIFADGITYKDMPQPKVMNK